MTFQCEIRINKIKLNDIAKKKGISNRQLAFAAQMQRSQLKALLR